MIDSKPKQKHIVVIGGGTGTYTVLSGLKKHPKETLSLSAIISASDSGGSTGRLRDEFGVLPVGDVRMALVALSEGERSTELLRKLFLYRFSKGEGLSGHNFGNLFLVALVDILGSEEKAIAFMSEILRVRGKVLPVTTSDVTLCAEYVDGSVLKGESLINEPPEGHDSTQRITRLFLEPTALLSPKARDAIAQADLIVLGPGDLYTSILSNVVVDGMSEALRSTAGKLVYVTNLMSKYGETHGLSAGECTDEVSAYIGRKPDYVLTNTAPLPEAIVRKYEAQSEFPVFDNLPDDGRIIRGDFLAAEEIQRPKGDRVKRSLIRHDSLKLADAIMSLL